MKRVKLLKPYCGTAGNFPAGREANLPDGEAEAFVRAGLATAIKPPQTVSVKRKKKVVKK